MSDSGRGADAVEHRGARLDIDEGACTLWLHGELDLSTRHLFTRAGNDLAARCVAARDRSETSESPRRDAAADGTAVIDTAGLKFIDAAGIGAVVTLHRTLADAGISLRMMHASAQVRRVSAICRLDHILGIQPTAPVSTMSSPGRVTV